MQKFKFKKKWVKRTVITGSAIVVVGGILTGVIIAASAKSATSTTMFRATQASTGSISDTLSESGTASCSAEYELTAANAGTVDKVCVSQGDKVKQGQVIAQISDTSSTETLIAKKSALTTAQSDLASAKESLNSLYTTAVCTGRIKSIKAEAGDNASAISNAFGYLMYLSVSGKTQTTISTTANIASGTSVYVKVGGNTYTGTISAGSTGGSGGSGSSVTVTINSDVPAVDAAATVMTKSGRTIGKGTVSLTSDAVKISASGSSSGGSAAGSTAGSSSSGTISAIYVSENEIVSKGTKLLKYDGSSVQSEITQKEQAVEQAQKDVENAQEAADKNTVTSPVTGTVASLSVSKGDNIQTSASIATVIDQNKMQTVLSVDEDDISSIKVGQSANITLTAIANKTFTGNVTKVDSLGTTSNNVTTYSVTVDINNPTGIKVGMTTDAEIVTQSKSNVVVVSSSAILEKQGTTGYVLTGSKMSGITKLSNVTTRELAEKYGTKVTLGLSNENQVEVTSGLNSGDTVEIPITINLAAVKSLNRSSTTSSNSFGMPGDMGGGMPGGWNGGTTSGSRGGFGGGAPGGATQRQGGTGNTVSG